MPVFVVGDGMLDVAGPDVDGVEDGEVTVDLASLEGGVDNEDLVLGA